VRVEVALGAVILGTEREMRKKWESDEYLWPEVASEVKDGIKGGSVHSVPGAICLLLM